MANSFCLLSLAEYSIKNPEFQYIFKGWKGRIMSHEDFIKIAIDLARENAAAGRQPYGAIVVRKSENSAGGGNRAQQK